MYVVCECLGSGPWLVLFLQDILREEKLNYKVVAMEEFQTSYNGFLNFLGNDFWSRLFY